MYDVNAYHRVRARANREYINEIRAQTVCAHCGAQPIEWHNPEHIEHPHKRVGNLAHWSRTAIDAEIARCTPLCRRCHMREDRRLAGLVARNVAQGATRPRSTAPCADCGEMPKVPRQGRCKNCYRRYRLSPAFVFVHHRKDPRP